MAPMLDRLTEETVCLNADVRQNIYYRVQSWVLDCVLCFLAHLGATGKPTKGNGQPTYGTHPLPHPRIPHPSSSFISSASPFIPPLPMTLSLFETL